jgi:hypothetical protein
MRRSLSRHKSEKPWDLEADPNLWQLVQSFSGGLAYNSLLSAGIAQLVEQLIRNQ